MEEKTFGNEFKELRIQTGLSQVDLGKILEIPRNTIRDWELEKRVPPTYVQRLLLKELNRIKNKIKKS
ncbi:helix-turn-helix transcriptional regulator [uncultured Megamonas sp.]|uniref:helix-turn-helix domain-containing protein n=1 Tax=uncultured Megamonas sp. TaxID=286140 RepID=UPI00259AEFB3|nr:helix-turn-helix transcriptional regulator [uncultured Megamonas sp.]